jgi:CBS domain-containing protein
MQVRDLMTANVVTIEPDATYKEAVESLLEHDVSGLPVVNGDGRLVGIVTEADLMVRAMYAGRRRRRALDVVADLLAGDRSTWTKGHADTVGEIMTAKLVTARPEDTVAAAARRMRTASVKRMPVVDTDGRLVGVVSRQDLLASYSRPDDAIANEVRAVLADPLACPEDHRIHVAVQDGVVALEGDVHYDRDRRAVEKIVAGIDGVVDVINLLWAREPDPVLDRIVKTPR